MGRSRAAWLAMGLVATTSVLAVLAAAVGGPWTMSNRSGLWGTDFGVETTRSPGSQPSPVPFRPSRLRDVPFWFGPLLWFIGAVVVLLAALWIWRTWFAGRFRGAHEVYDAAPGIPGEVYADRPVVRAGLATALEVLLQTADPTDAVLAAWVHLEAAADRSGLTRQPSDTPTEFTARVLTATPADHEAVAMLLQLYHRARFSPRGLSAADFGDARDCLTRLAASWADFDAPVAGGADER